jgi:hypothetical protein
VDLLAGNVAGGVGEVLSKTAADGIAMSTPYRYHRFVVDGNGSNNCFVCEIVWYEDL